MNVCDTCAKHDARLILMSTDSCSGYTTDRVFGADEPDNSYGEYGRTKLAGERYALDLSARGKLRATSLRGFWFFGPLPPQRNMGLLNCFKLPLQPMFGNGKNLRSISHLDDIVGAFALAERSEASVGKWYWLPTHTATVNEIYGIIAGALGKTARPVRIPNAACS